MLVIATLLRGIAPSHLSVYLLARASSSPPLALFRQNETSQIKRFTQLFQKAGSFGQKWVKDSSREQLRVSGINLNGQKTGKKQRAGQGSDLSSWQGWIREQTSVRSSRQYTHAG